MVFEEDDLGVNFLHRLDTGLQHNDDLGDIHGILPAEIEQKQHKIDFVLNKLCVVDQVAWGGLAEVGQQDDRCQEFEHVDHLAFCGARSLCVDSEKFENA